MSQQGPSSNTQPIVNDEPEIVLDFGSEKEPRIGYTDNQTFSDFSEVADKEPHYVSFFSTVMNLLNSLVGAEILSISNSMTSCGLVFSILLMTLTASLSYVATIMTVRLQYRTNTDSLQDIATKILGPKGAHTLAFLTLFFCYSCCVAYLIIGGDDIKSWLTLLHHEEWMEGWKRSIIMLIYSLVLPVALTLPKKIGFISAFSTFSIVCLVVFVIMMVYKAATYLPTHGISPTVKTFSINFGLFHALAIYSLMFALPAIVLPILKPSNPDIHKRFQIIGTAFFSCFICVIIPGVLGYIMFGKNTNEIILSSFDNGDIAIQIVRIAFFVVVTASYPVIALSIMTDLSSIIFHIGDPSSLPNKKRVVVLLATNVPPVLVGMLCPSIAPVLSIGGSLGGCLTNFFFPAILWIVHSDKKWTHWTNILCILLAAFGLVSACIATFMAFLSFKESKSK